MKYIATLLLLLSALFAFSQEQITNLPTIYISTEGGQGVYDKENYVPGTVTIVTDNKDDAIKDKAMGIRGRGNSTWGMAKKPYRIKFDKKINLFNRPAKAKSWVLLANYADKTLMRNAVAFELSRFVGFDFSPSAIFADVVLNGEFLGNYMVSDQMEVNPGRVEIDEMDATCLEGESLTGGYFLEIDGFGGSEPVHFTSPKGLIFTVKSPKDDVIQTPQLTYIRNFINKFENTLFSSNFDDPEGGFRAMVDERSLVNWYICCELTGNSDSFWSTYIYKKRSDNHLYFGPLWDFDIAFNNDNRLGDAVNSLMRTSAHEPRTWISRMWQAKWFRNAVFTRWCELIDEGVEDFLISFIDDTEAMLNQSQALNFQKWPILNRRVYREQFLFSTYERGVDYLRKYVSERIEFLNTLFAMSLAPSEVEGIVSGSKYYLLHYVDLYATPEVSNFYIRNYEGESQKLTFESIGDEGYWNIRMPDGRYLGSTDFDKYCVYLANPSDPHAQFIVEHSPFDGYARIKNKATGKYLGVEHTAHNSRISTNKSGAELNHAWKVIPVDYSNSITDITADTVKPVFDTATKTLSTDHAADICVYTVDGRLVISESSARSVSLSSLTPGIYIVNVDGSSALKIAL